MPEPEKATPGVPGAPRTSPAEATLALAPATATAHSAAAKKDFLGSMVLLSCRTWTPLCCDGHYTLPGWRAHGYGALRQINTRSRGDARGRNTAVWDC